MARCELRYIDTHAIVTTASIASNNFRYQSKSEKNEMYHNRNIHKTTHICMHTHLQTCKHAHAHAHAHAHMHTGTDAHRYTDTHTQTQIQGDRQKHRHRDTQSYRHTDAQV